MSIQFAKATKSQAKARVAIFGPAGAGKTMTALRIATGLAGEKGRIAVLDTEHGSASKYADRFTFDTCKLGDSASVEVVAEGLQAAKEGGYDVVVVDSLSHSWQELLADVEKIAKAKYRGNTWSAWSEGTPKQQAMVKAILRAPFHLIATMRSKTAWLEEKDERTGRVKPVRVGLAPEAGKGIEYEFDLLMEMNPEHFATIIKDRTGKYQDALLEKPGEDFGRALAAWLSDAPPPAKLASETLVERLGVSGVTEADATAFLHARKKLAAGESVGDMPEDRATALMANIDAFVAAVTEYRNNQQKGE